MNQEKKAKKSVFNVFLDTIERVGNKFPNPVTMFFALAVFVVILSGILSAVGLSAVNPADGSVVEVFNLLSADGIRYLWTNIIKNYAGFAPLGTVLIALVGSSVAEKSGFLATVMQKFLGGAKGWIVTMTVIFLGTNMNIAGDTGNVILTPLAAILFMSVGRHPLLGMYTAVASIGCGFAANMLIGLTDALLYGFTESAAQMIDPSYHQSIAVNWYFLLVSCLVLTASGTLLVEKVLIKRFPISKEELAKFDFKDERKKFTPEENRALKMAGLSALGLLAVVLLLSLPVFGPVAILADETGSLTASAAPFSKGIVFTVTLFFFVPGLVYGICTGRYKKDTDVWKDINDGFAGMGHYVFMCLFISIFTNFFSVSKIGTIAAIRGAEFLSSIGLVGIPLCVGLIVLTGCINLLMGSASAKWAVLAPIFVPLMMLLGYDPAFAQIVYRIGDSLTNPITPLYTALPIVLSFAKKYDDKVGVGTVIANVLPFACVFAVVWFAQLMVWYFLNLPLGPGGAIFLS